MSSRATTVVTTAAAAALCAAGVGVLAGPAGASATVPSAAVAACAKTPWEAKVQGVPAGFGAGSPSGDYLWHDTHGFHLRVTHVAHDQRVSSGQITSSAAMRVEPVCLERSDTVNRSAGHRTLTFVPPTRAPSTVSTSTPTARRR